MFVQPFNQSGQLFRLHLYFALAEPTLAGQANDGVALVQAVAIEAFGRAGQPLQALEPPGPDRRLEVARQLAKDNPVAMANLVRGWMNN